jgi:NarL family two-component system response regulator LiaR
MTEHDPARAITILLVDDHAMVREGLRSMLDAHDLQVIGEAASGREAIELARRLRPDIVLMDVRMPDVNGLTALEVIKGESPATAVIILTTYDNPEYHVKAVMGGAAGYLLKDISHQELADAIHTVAEGGSLIDRQMLLEVVRKLEQGARTGAGTDEERSRAEALTEREVAVLRLIVEGLSNREIAEVLCISAGTVKTHVEHIIQKLQVSDRTQAAVWAVRQGIAH